MPEYIEAPRCKTCFHKDACGAWIRHGIILYNDFQYSVENCPHYHSNENVVEVVRCAECRHYNPGGCANGFGWCEYYNSGATDDHYCSHGERRLIK